MGAKFHKAMNSINRIELQGRVGTVRTAELSSGTVASFSLVTDHFFKTRDGDAVCETTWFHVSAYQNSCLGIDLKALKKGDPVHVTGRMRCSKYTTAEGVDRQFYEVVADSVEPVSE